MREWMRMPTWTGLAFTVAADLCLRTCRGPRWLGLFPVWFSLDAYYYIEDIDNYRRTRHMYNVVLYMTAANSSCIVNTGYVDLGLDV